ncbi:MAG TPA: hypothetical protein VF590_27635, partial [Isosphaeraceae bacterium]
MNRHRIRPVLIGFAVACATGGIGRADEPAREASSPRARLFRAGACVVDVSPPRLPVLINGGFLQATAGTVRDPLHARCLVLDDGATRIALVVVDSCMMPRD